MAKIKTYYFTEVEVLALRDALEDFHAVHKNDQPYSPIFRERNRAAAGLCEQFKDDYRLW